MKRASTCYWVVWVRELYGGDDAGDEETLGGLCGGIVGAVLVPIVGSTAAAVLH